MEIKLAAIGCDMEFPDFIFDVQLFSGIFPIHPQSNPKFSYPDIYASVITNSRRTKPYFIAPNVLTAIKGQLVFILQRYPLRRLPLTVLLIGNPDARYAVKKLLFRRKSDTGSEEEIKNAGVIDNKGRILGSGGVNYRT